MPTIETMLRRTARRFGDKPALVCGSETVSFAQLDQRSNQVAAMLRRNGIGPSDRVAIVRNSGISFVEDQFGIYKTGAAEVAINARLTVYEQLDLLRHAQPSAVLLDAEYADRAASFASLPSVRLCVSTSEDRERLLAKEACDQPPSSGASEESIWRLHYSSGTTGKPKAAVLVQRNFIAAVNSYLHAVGGIGHQEVLVDPAPLVTAGSWALWPHHLSGCTCVIVPRFDAGMFIETTQRQKATSALVVPTMVADLVEARPEREELKSLSTVLYTASAMNTAVIEAAIDLMGYVFVQAYSMSETMTALTVLSKDDHRSGDLRMSAGFPLLDTDIRIVDEDERELATGSPGRIAIRTSSTMREYWRDPELTQSALHDGSLFSGDIGRLDLRGCLFVLDRADDVIITGGFNVYPREVEDVLLRHPLVAEAAVVGVPDGRLGHSVAAVIRRREGDGLADQELQQFARGYLATYKVPKTFVVSRSSLPRNAAGKLLRREVRQRLIADGVTAGHVDKEAGTR
jgi:acyl-CoA synthetase (AMP-forming)/AMP-acid ligase II